MAKHKRKDRALDVRDMELAGPVIQGLEQLLTRAHRIRVDRRTSHRIRQPDLRHSIPRLVPHPLIPRPALRPLTPRLDLRPLLLRLDLRLPMHPLVLRLLQDPHGKDQPQIQPQIQPGRAVQQRKNGREHGKRLARRRKSVRKLRRRRGGEKKPRSADRG